MIDRIAINKKLLTFFTLQQSFDNNIQIYEDISEVRNKSSVFFFGSIEDCKYLQSMNFGTCRYFNLHVSDFLPFVGDQYVNFDGYYKQSIQLNSYDVGKFIRSDSGNKVWSSQVTGDKYELMFVKQQLQQSDLLYISSAKWIRDECRYWIVDDQIIGYSRYNNPFVDQDQSRFKQHYDKQLYDNYINEVIKNWGPDDMYTIDVGLFGNDLYIIEYNCFSTSGFYNSNVNQICKSTIEYLNKGN